MAGKNKYFKILLTTVSSILAAAILTFSNAAAFDIDENTRERREIKEENKKYTEELNATEEAIKQKEEYSKKLQNNISDLTKKIRSSNDKIKKLNTQISEKQAQIDARLAEIEDTLDMLRERLRAIYTAGDVSTLEVILQAKDFSDFLDKMEIVQSIASYDDQLINKLKGEMKGIGTQQEKLRQDKSAVEAEKKKLEDNKARVNALSAENEALLMELNAAKEKTENALEENEKRQKELEDALREYNAELAERIRKQRELQKQRAEERKAREAEKRALEEERKRQLAETGKTDIPEQTFDDDEQYVDVSGEFVWPCPGHTYLTSTFDEWRGVNNHGALDIADGSVYGAPVVACYYGTVFSTYNGCVHDWGKSSSCGCGGGYGNYVMIDHGDGKVSIYGHLCDVVVEPGQEVLPGQLIGYVGSTGYSTGPHLHFEMQYYGVRYDPLEEYQ